MLKGLVLSSMVAAMAVPTNAGAEVKDTKEAEVKNENQVQLEINMDELGIKADEAFELDLNALGVEAGEAFEYELNLDMDELGIKADEAFEVDVETSSVDKK